MMGAQPEQIFVNDVVTEKLMAASSGLTEDALAHYRRDCKVTEGVHWFVGPNKRIMWDVQEFNQWLKESKSTKAKSGSRSRGAGRGSTKRQNSGPPLQV